MTSEADMPTAAAPLAFNTPGYWRWVGALRKARLVSRDEGLRGLDDRYLGTMDAGYRRSGGIASCDDIAIMLRPCWDQPLSRLAGWLVSREVVNFRRERTIWLPLFQFERAAMTLRPEVTAAIRELSEVFDDVELAAWFALPNTWLRGSTPVDALTAEPLKVHQAARADGFLARGQCSAPPRTSAFNVKAFT